MLLTTLHLHGRSATISDLASMTRIDLSAASRQLRDLERAGLVERSADAADRRVIHLRLTPDGRRMAKRLVDTRRGHLERAVAHWPAEKRLLFADMINELVDALMGTDVDSPR
jgi:DNA-binding MarR family transcriptional regulator